MNQGERKRIEDVVERMRSMCSTLRGHCPKSQCHVSLESVEKWAREIEAITERVKREED